MNIVTSNAKALAGVGGAAATVIGFYLGWPEEIVAAMGVILTGALVWLTPNKGGAS